MLKCLTEQMILRTQYDSILLYQYYCTVFCCIEGKSKAIPVQALRVPGG